jgi:hypothetical protein
VGIRILPVTDWHCLDSCMPMAATASEGMVARFRSVGECREPDVNASLAKLPSLESCLPRALGWRGTAIPSETRAPTQKGSRKRCAGDRARAGGSWARDRVRPPSLPGTVARPPAAGREASRCCIAPRQGTESSVFSAHPWWRRWGVGSTQARSGKNGPPPATFVRIVLSLTPIRKECTF